MKAVFVDIETTGLDFDVHVPIDIAILIHDFNEIGSAVAYTSCISCDAKDWDLADKRALEVNGYNPGNLFACKNSWQVGKEIEDFLVKNEVVKGKAFFICQNPSFDRPFFIQLMSQKRMNELNMPYHWLDLASMYFMKFYAQLCIASELSLSKDSIAKSLGLSPEKKPHRALNGVMHLAQCYKACVHSSYCNPPVIDL